jgi:hypothetical protein
MLAWQVILITIGYLVSGGIVGGLAAALLGIDPADPGNDVEFIILAVAIILWPAVLALTAVAFLVAASRAAVISSRPGKPPADDMDELY